MDFLHPHHQLPDLFVHPAHHSHSLADHHPDERCSRFPTSQDRFGEITTPPFESILYPPARYDPLGSLTKDEHALARKALCSSFTPLFIHRAVSRGVLSDGTWTTEHPSVHAFLQSPSSRPNITSRTSAAIYSLAALHVFYSPSHPSYDVFWHPDIKEATAMFVHEVVTMKPSPISTTPMTWLGVHDMLWQLTGIQKEYAKSQGGKTSTLPPVPTRRSLRKRKPVQALIQELSTREPSEAPEPARKKIKKSVSDENEKGGETSPPIEQLEVSIENEAGPSDLTHTLSTTPSLQETPGTADATPSPLTITSSLPSESQPSTKDDVIHASTSRSRTKDAGNKKANANPSPSRSSARRARERSPSFSSGSSTAVSAAGSKSKRARSSSTSSSSTTVEGTASSKGKGKEKAVEAASAVDEETDEEVQKRPTKTRRTSTTTKEAGPKASRKSEGALASGASVEIDKVAAAEAPRKARKRSRVTSSRPRKARKS